jgi:hypothetical protein
VLGREAPAAVKKSLLRPARRAPGPAALFCPDEWAAPSRLLLLCQDGPPGGPLLDAVAELCRRLRATPVVLTAAPSERLARLRQQATREVLARHGLAAEFDLVVGRDARAAAASVARWRRCGLVVAERPAACSWWRWLRGDTPERLAGLAETLPFLALPGAGALSLLSSGLTCTAPASAESSPQPAFH